jgi:predicted PurR-regulated permease PerM
MLYVVLKFAVVMIVATGVAFALSAIVDWLRRR